MSTVLHQFAFSHFNEKARWALTYKDVVHERNTYLPGPHMPAIKKLTGQTQTPVLQIGESYVAGSDAIIDALETSHPQPALYPADPELCEKALAIQAHWDGVIGPAVRTVVFSSLVNNGGYLVAMFGGGKSLPKRLAYRATFPLARPLIAKSNGVTDPENVRKSFEITKEALDIVAEATQQTGFMVGDAFTIADLTAAALLAPIADVQHPDMCRPKPMPEDLSEIIEQYSGHPGVTWVNSIYRRFR